MPRIIVFDVNETLLDVSALEPDFVRVFGDGRALREWFSTLLLYSEGATLAGPYADFPTIGRAALEMTAMSRGVQMSDEDRDRILGSMLALPAHPEVPAGLQRLRDAGLRLVALTKVLYPLAPPPDIVGPDLRVVADQIVAAEEARRDHA